MDYQAMYQQKLTTAEEAVKVVRSGDWVDYTWCTNHPVALDKALAARKDELTDVKVRGGVTMWMPEICQGGGRRRPLHLALLALQRHRPEDHHQGHGLLQPHALLRAAPLLPGESGPGGRGDAPGHPHGQPTATSTSAWRPPTWPTCCPVPSASSWRSTRTCPGCTASPAREINIQDVDLCGGGGQSPRGPAGRRRRAHRRGPGRGQPGGAPDSQRGLPPAGHRRHAQHHRRHDRPVRPEGPGCPHRDVCGRLRGHGAGGQDHRPAQGPGQGPPGVRLRRRHPEAL